MDYNRGWLKCVLIGVWAERRLLCANEDQTIIEHCFYLEIRLSKGSGYANGEALFEAQCGLRGVRVK